MRHTLWLISLLGTLIAVVFCEYAIYFVVISRCAWPELGTSNVKALILSDPHVLGSANGAFIDRLRREWQMERAFQTALRYFKPDVVFILGDLFDEGNIASDEDFNVTLMRFRRIFWHSGAKLHVVIGNHDAGFHYDVTPEKVSRFQKNLNTSSVYTVTLNKVQFVLLNSVALEGDSCWLCSEAEAQLKQTASRLRDCPDVKDSKVCSRQMTSQPIILQHFPFYRPSDAMCAGEDALPPEDRLHVHRERWDVVSKEASEQVIALLQPRFAFSGHTHHGCFLSHSGGFVELTVPSFSWRNRNNPSFILFSASAYEQAFEKCFLPRESTVFFVYASAVFFVVYSIVSSVFRSRRRVRHLCLLCM